MFNVGFSNSGFEGAFDSIFFLFPLKDKDSSLAFNDVAKF